MLDTHEYSRSNIRRQLDERLPDLVCHHIVQSVAVYDNTPNHGFYDTFDPRPCEGRVIDVDEKAFFVWEAERRLHVVERALATHEPKVGDWVRVIPYIRRGFDGQRADEVNSPVKLPLPEPRCPQLSDMLGVMNNAKMPDGIRRLPHMLADAGARDFRMEDPEPDRIHETQPLICFTVETQKHSGQVRVFYGSKRDAFGIWLIRDGRGSHAENYIPLNQLGQRLFELIDDGTWNRIVVEPIDMQLLLKRLKKLAADHGLPFSGLLALVDAVRRNRI